MIARWLRKQWQSIWNFESACMATGAALGGVVSALLAIQATPLVAIGGLLGGRALAQGFKGQSTRSSWATGGVSLALVITTSLLIWRVILVAGALDDVGAGTVTQLQYDAVKTTDSLVFIAWFVTAILFARWLYVKVQEFAPVETGRWWNWLIPVFNFFVLIKAVWNLHGKAGATWEQGTMRTMILIWASLLLTGEVVSSLSNTMSLDTLNEAQSSLRILMVGNVLLAAAGIACLGLVLQIGAKGVGRKPFATAADPATTRALARDNKRFAPRADSTAYTNQSAIHAATASAIASSNLLPAASKPTRDQQPASLQAGLTLAELHRFGLASAQTMLMSEVGRNAAYWQESQSGKPEVTGAAFVIGSYTWFVMGCSVAGVAADFRKDKAFRLPVAESLAAYYLDVPINKSRLNMHFAKADAYLRSKEPDLQRAVVDTRSVLLRNDAGIANDEKLMTILRDLMYQEIPLSVEEAIDGFGTFFNFGLWLDPDEVERLWGTQVSMPAVPLMEQPLAEARAEMLAEASQFTAAQVDKSGAELSKHDEEAAKVIDLTEALRAAVEEVRARKQAASLQTPPDSLSNWSPSEASDSGVENLEPVSINYGSAKSAMGNVGRGFGIGALIGGLGVLQFLGVAIAFAFAALMYWISDRAYDVSWVLGVPIRIVAFMTAVGAFFAVLAAVINVAAFVFVGVSELLRSAFGRRD